LRPVCLPKGRFQPLVGSCGPFVGWGHPVVTRLQPFCGQFACQRNGTGCLLAHTGHLLAGLPAEGRSQPVCGKPACFFVNNYYIPKNYCISFFHI
jgi:hypothetical protein